MSKKSGKKRKKKPAQAKASQVARKRASGSFDDGSHDWRLASVVKTVSVNHRVVSYRMYVNGELQGETPHTGRGGMISAVIANITPGVTLRSGIRTVSNFGLTSDPAEAVGRAPFESDPVTTLETSSGTH